MKPSEFEHPDGSALIQTRRWVFVLGISIAYLISLILGLTGWRLMTSVEHALILFSIPWFILGLLMNRAGTRLWLFAPALASLVLCCVVAPRSHPQWIALVLLVSYLSYMWAVLMPRWMGMLAIILGPLALAGVWSQRPTNAIAGGLVLADGSLALIQVAAATGMIWWAWNSLRLEADVEDARLVDLDEQTSRALEITERAAMWRLAGTRLHESILNSIRYLLASASAVSVDREQLRAFAEVALPTPEDSGLEPLVGQPELSRSDFSEPFNKGRLLVTAALAGNAFGGITFLFYLLAEDGTSALPAVILGSLGSSSCLVVVLRRRRISMRWAIPLVVIPALLPWFFVSQDLGCRQALLLAPVLNIAGFCVMVIAAWATRTAGVVGLLTWGSGAILIALRMPTDCRQFMSVALVNSLVALPLIIAVTYAGTAAYLRARSRAMEIRQQEIRERSRAIAATEINAELHDVVQEAVALIGAIADGATLDGGMRERLRLIDGRIRADMQVDPQGAGTLAVLAKSLVDALAARGIVTLVKGISSSADARPLPAPALELVYALVGRADDRVSIQVISDGHEDFLSLGVPTHAIQAEGLGSGTLVTWEDVTVECDVDNGSSVATIVLSRPVASAS